MRFSFSLRNTSFVRGFFVAFVLGFVVRLIPEVLSYPHPIGFDTIFYAWRIDSGVVLYNWSSVFSSWWLFFALLIPVYNVLQVDPFLLLKLTAPLLFGLNACGVYYFAMRALNWGTGKSLFAAILFSFQVAALRISWDLYRNALGIGILLFVLPCIKNSVNSVKEFLVFVLLSVLVVFGHEFGSVILFVAVLGVALSGFLKGAERGELKVLAASVPALALLLASVYFVAFPVSHVAETNVVSVYQPVGHYQGPLFFFSNYLTVHDAVYCYPTYLDLVFHVLSLFALLYIVTLPLVLVGFFRDRVLDCWTALLLVGAFGALVTPFFALGMWSRWMLMLVYPFTFYAANGVTKVMHSDGKTVSLTLRWLRLIKLSKRTVKGILVLSFSLGLVFMATPLFFGRAGTLGLPTTVSYVPSTMQSNSLPLVDVEDTIKAMQWLDRQMNSSSVLLAQDAFLWWANIYLDSKHMIAYFNNDVKGAIDVAMKCGFTQVYFVWWNDNTSWYRLTVPNGFAVVYSSGRISAFEYFG